jgi:hypothetical protein
MYLVRRAFLTGLLILGTVAFASAQMPADELVVRSTYAKAMMAYEIERVSPALQGVPNAASSPDHLNVAVSAVKLGPIADISEINIEDLVTKPAGYVLHAQVVTADVPGKHTGFKSLVAPDWQVAPVVPDNWAIPFSGVLSNLPGQAFRYASFDVTLTFKQRQRQYKALFLFGVDTAGNSQVFAFDHVLGMSAVNHLLTAPIDQEIVTLQAEHSDKAALAPLLLSVQPQSGCQVDAQSSFCCNPATGHCGVNKVLPVSKPVGGGSSTSLLLGTTQAASTLAAASPSATCTAPACSTYNTAGPMIPLTAAGTTAHWTGQHTGSATAQSFCSYDGTQLPCTPRCHVSVQLVELIDRGFPKGFPLYIHELGEDRASADGTSTCKGFVAFGGVQCIAATFCIVTVSGGGEGVKVEPAGSVVWARELDYTPSTPCPTIQ